MADAMADAKYKAGDADEASIHIDVPDDKITADRLKHTTVTRAATSPRDVAGWGETAISFLSIPNLFRFIFFGTIISVTIVVCLYQDYYTVIWATPVISVFYFFYWVDILAFNTTFKFLANTTFVLDLFKHVDLVKQQGVPLIMWHMKCYHMETQDYMIHSNGRTHHHTRLVKVITWTGDQPFEFRRFQDFSDELPVQRMFESKAIRATFRKIYRFADEPTKLTYEEQFNWFVSQNRGRDRSYTIRESYMITNYQKRAMSFVGGVKPWYMSWWWYILACFPLMEMPYNFLIQKNSRKLEFVYVKELSIL